MGSVNSDGTPSEGIQVEKNEGVGWSGWPQDRPSRVARQGKAALALSLSLSLPQGTIETNADRMYRMNVCTCTV